MPSDRDAILEFIQRMGFNPRDALTWDGLKMCAMTAWMGERLIGAIPLEPRQLRIAEDWVVASVHETVVAVEPEFRGGGIGSRMQEAIAQQRPGDAKIVTVFREEPGSAAYRWYLKNGFCKTTQIVSWMGDEAATIANGANMRMWRADDASLPWNEIESRRGDGNLVADRPLRRWLAVHPYRGRYAFHVVSDGGGAFALLGVGMMHSQTMRVEVLEMIAPEDRAAGLLRAVAAAAMREGWTPIRLPLAVDDPNGAVARSLGFTAGWTFDVLMRSLDPDVNVRLEKWRYAGIDYI
jgi:ribosomal protein S18 acetylase RimI-like enzyme